MTGRCRVAQTTSSLQNFSALAMSKAPAWKATLDSTKPQGISSAPALKRAVPVTTPQGGRSWFSAASMEWRNPGKAQGSELMRSPNRSRQPVKKASMMSWWVKRWAPLARRSTFCICRSW